MHFPLALADLLEVKASVGLALKPYKLFYWVLHVHVAHVHHILLYFFFLELIVKVILVSGLGIPWYTTVLQLVFLLLNSWSIWDLGTAWAMEVKMGEVL